MLPDENWEFIELANDFLRERAEFSSNATINNYERALRPFAFLNISDFERPDFLAYIKNHAKPHWNRRTVEWHQKVLCIFGNWLCDNHITQRHQRHKFTKKPVQRDIPETWEVDLIFSAVRQNYEELSGKRRFVNHQRYIILRVLYETGCRIGECLSLYLDDVRIKNSKHFILIRGTKSDSAERTVLITDKLFDELNQFRNCYELTGRLFSTSAGGVCYPEDVSHWLSKFGKSLKISCRIYPHLFRYLFIIEWIRNGKPLNELMHRLGHSDVSMTIYYAKQVARLCHDIDISDSISILERQKNLNAHIYNKQKTKGRKNYD